MHEINEIGDRPGYSQNVNISTDEKGTFFASVKGITFASADSGVHLGQWIWRELSPQRVVYGYDLSKDKGSYE